ncbi:MAG: monovalent cation/H+ antiporter subunit D family protein [Paracoccaceae bacterium]
MSEQTIHIARSFSDHLPVLQVMVPFIVAPIIVMIGSRRAAWPLAFAASLATFAIALTLLLKVLGGAVISYEIGGWAPPLGIEYRIDAANALVLLLVSAIGAIVLIYARESVRSEIPAKHHTLFYTMYLLCLSGLLGVVATGDAFNVFVFLEVSSLSTYVLISMGSHRDRRALTAAFDYLIMGTIGATFFVIGIGFLYAGTGTLNMADIASYISTHGADRTIQTAFAFVVVGMGLKAAAYPLHLWLPNAYTYAPSVVSAFLAATATKVAIYVLMRFMFTVFQPEFLISASVLKYLLIPLAVLAMFAASLIAVFQNDMKRMLAYSSIGQIGYILLGIGLLSHTGLSAAIVHLFNHGITKAALFMGVGALVYRSGSSFYGRLEGMGKTMPFTSFAIVLAGLSLIGIPGTAGFISKWVLVQAALEKGWWPIAMLVVGSSLLAVIYVWRVVETLYMKPRAKDAVRGEAPLSMLIPVWIMALATIYFGLNTELTLTTARLAADGLLAGFGAGGH